MISGGLKPSSNPWSRSLILEAVVYLILAAAAVNSHLDADAEEWLRGAVAMDGRFKG